MTTLLVLVFCPPKYGIHHREDKSSKSASDDDTNTRIIACFTRSRLFRQWHRLSIAQHVVADPYICSRIITVVWYYYRGLKFINRAFAGLK
jgi:predicted HD phosphohydrolase